MPTGNPERWRKEAARQTEGGGASQALGSEVSPVGGFVVSTQSFTEQGWSRIGHFVVAKKQQDRKERGRGSVHPSGTFSQEPASFNKVPSPTFTIPQ